MAVFPNIKTIMKDVTGEPSRIIAMTDVGSHTWGFAGKDSDYDLHVLFQYTTQRKMYPLWQDLSDTHKCDIVQDGQEYNHVFWTIEKFLDLLYKGNVQAIELGLAIQEQPEEYHKTIKPQALSTFLELLYDAIDLRQEKMIYHYLGIMNQIYTKLSKPDVDISALVNGKDKQIKYILYLYRYIRMTRALKLNSQSMYYDNVFRYKNGLNAHDKLEQTVRKILKYKKGISPALNLDKNEYKYFMEDLFIEYENLNKKYEDIKRTAIMTIDDTLKENVEFKEKILTWYA